MPDNLNPAEAQAIVRYGDREFRFTHSDPKDHIFSTLTSSGKFYEIELLEKVSSLLSAGDIVADVGANIGTHSIFWSGVCGAHVVAFEPDAETAAILRRNIELNGLGQRIRVEQIGLGSKPGGAKAVLGSQHNRGMMTLVAEENGPIRVCRLDDVSFDGPVRLLKIDVEGMERQVLEGATKTLKRNHPIVVVEAGDRASFVSVASFLRPLGYKVVGTFNWTPTHLFVPGSEASFKSVDGALTESFALVRFEWTSLRDGVMSRLASLDTKLNDQSQQLKSSVSTQAEGTTKQLADLAGKQTEHIKQFAQLQANLVSLKDNVSEGLSAVEARFQPLNELQEALTSSQMKVAALEKELALNITQGIGTKAAADAAVVRASALERELAVSVAQGTQAQVALDGVTTRITALERELSLTIAERSQLKTAAEVAGASLAALEKEFTVVVAQREQTKVADAIRIAVLEKELAEGVARGNEAKAALAAAEMRASALEQQLLAEVARSAEASAAVEAAEARSTALERELARAVEQDRESKVAAEAACSRISALETELTATAARFNSIAEVNEAKACKQADRIAALEAELLARDVVLREQTEQSHATASRARSLEVALASREADVARAMSGKLDAENQLIQRDNRCKQLSTQIELLDQQKSAIEASSRSEVSRLRKKLGIAQTRAASRAKRLQQRMRDTESIQTELARTRELLQEFVGGMEAISVSRRWKIGDAFGRVTDKLLLRDKSPHVMDQMRAALAGFRAGESHGDDGGVATKRSDSRTKPQVADANYSESTSIEGDGHPQPISSAQHLAKMESLAKAQPSAVCDRLARAEPYENTLSSTQAQPSRQEEPLLAATPASQSVSTEVSRVRPIGVSIATPSDAVQAVVAVKGAAEVNARHKSAPAISVVMTAFNAEKTIRKSIDSVLQQDMRDFELIVVDDKSSDGTASIVREARSSDERVRLLQCHANRGTYWAKNLGIVHARGRYIALHDSDDESKPARLRRQIEALLDGTNKRVCYTNWMRVDQRGDPILNRGLYERLGYPTLMFPRALIEDIGFFDSTRIAADDEFHKRVIKKYGASGVAHIREAHYLAAMEENSLTAKNPVTMTLRDPNDPLSFLSDDRRRYVDLYGEWHAAAGQALCMPFPQRRRPFPVPPGMRVESMHADEMIIGSVASFPKRLEGLKRVVRDVIGQVDLLRVHLNNYDSEPEFLRHPRISVTRSQETGDLRDNGKFLNAESLPDGFHITFDDDLAYPPYYVNYLISKVLQYDKKAIVGLHGTIINRPFIRYHDKNSRQTYTYRLPLVDDKSVHILGTGTTAYHTSALKFGLSDIHSKGMVDIWLAIKAKREGVPMICVSRGPGWLADQEGFSDASLYQEYLHNDSAQTALVEGERLWEIAHPFAL